MSENSQMISPMIFSTCIVLACTFTKWLLLLLSLQCEFQNGQTFSISHQDLYSNKCFHFHQIQNLYIQPCSRSFSLILFIEHSEQRCICCRAPASNFILVYIIHANLDKQTQFPLYFQMMQKIVVMSLYFIISQELIILQNRLQSAQSIKTITSPFARSSKIINTERQYVPYFTRIFNSAIPLFCIKSQEYNIASTKFLL